MATAANKSEKKELSTQKLTELAKDLYLANLGVYGKIYEVIGEKIDLYNVKRADLFKDSGQERRKSPEDRRAASERDRRPHQEY